MAAVALDALRKVFPNGTVAVDSLSLDIEHGEFMVLLGPSGSGKTTMLRLVAGLEQPTAGHIYLDGQMVDRLSPKQRNVAMVFQDYALYPHLTVGQNIAFPLRAAQIDEATTVAQVHDAAVRLHIDGLLDRLPHQLSGGEQQRVALARAAVRRPTVCLLDEPLSNLHAQLRLDMCEQIHDLNTTMGVTTLYVTHARSEALAVADRVAVIRHGRLQQVGSPSQVYDDPATLFVASLLIRDINLVQGAVYARGGDGGAVIDLGSQGLNVDAGDPAAALLAAHHTARVTVAIRADALTLVAPTAADAALPNGALPNGALPNGAGTVGGGTVGAGTVGGGTVGAAPARPARSACQLRGTVRRVTDVGPELVVEVDTGAVPIVPDTDDRDVGGEIDVVPPPPAPHGALRRVIARLGPASSASHGGAAAELRMPAATARTEYGFYPTYEPDSSTRDSTGDLVLRLPVESTPRPRVGDSVTLAVDLGRVYLFDTVGTRIRLFGPPGAR
jgi:multiple sugar transport system ATP-binding protein